MSSHPPMEKLEAGSEPGPPSDLARRAGRDANPAGIGGLCRRAYQDTHKLAVDWSIRKSTSSTSRLCRIAVTFLTLGLRRPDEVYRKTF